MSNFYFKGFSKNRLFFPRLYLTLVFNSQILPFTSLCVIPQFQRNTVTNTATVSLLCVDAAVSQRCQSQAATV